MQRALMLPWKQSQHESDEDGLLLDTESGDATPSVSSRPRKASDRRLWYCVAAAALASAAALLYVSEGSHAELDAEVSKWLGLLEDNVRLSNETIGYIKNSNNRCLDLRRKRTEGSQGQHELVVAECNYSRIINTQLWVVNASQGTIRNLLSDNQCLHTPSFLPMVTIGSSQCKDDSQKWAIAAEKRLVTLQSLDGERSHLWCGVPSLVGTTLGLQTCTGLALTSSINPDWELVGLDNGSFLVGSNAGRPKEALNAELARRKAAQAAKAANTGALLTLQDAALGADALYLLNNSFWWQVRDLFTTVSPSWGRWQELISLCEKLAADAPGSAAIGTTILTNFLSNMVFAAMNFVRGSNGENLDLWGRYKINLQQFTGQPLTCDDSTAGEAKSGRCTWQATQPNETVNITPISEYVNHSNLSDQAFTKIYTGRKVPSWESGYGQQLALGLTARGLQAANNSGYDPTTQAAKTASNQSARFAFDLEGLLAILGEGFGWYDLRETKYASNGAYGASVMETKLAQSGKQDLLGLLMTESVLSMHLSMLQDGVTPTLVANLSAFEKYEPIPGYARLGGKAIFAVQGGTLTTVQLEYGGQTYTSFQDAQSDADFANNKLSGWRYAEKAIIASLLAKTQLLVHVKAIHMELAAALQAVTIDAMAINDGSGRHPLHFLLEPFISRNMQATNNNLKVWFDFRAGEFGLAPLPVEEQLKLLSDTMKEAPLNLTDLDMEVFAKARGMEKFKEGNASWKWTWHYRALKVQRKFESLIRSWLKEGYSSQTSKLLEDPVLVKWWATLFQHMPSLVVAEDSSSWLTSPAGTYSGSNSSDQVVGPASTSTLPWEGYGQMPPLQVSIPQVPTVIKMLTTRTFTSTTYISTSAGYYNSVADLPQPNEGGAYANPAAPVGYYNPVISATTTQQGFLQSLFSGGRRLATNASQAISSSLPASSTSLETSPLPVTSTIFTSTQTLFTSTHTIVTSTLTTATSTATTSTITSTSATTTSETSTSTSTTSTASSVTSTTTSSTVTTLRNVPEVSVEALVRVLRTLLVWTSWIHEDVGHAFATFVYNPVLTPGFLPADGVGIPLAPLAIRVAAFRNFMAVERPRILDNADLQLYVSSRNCGGATNATKASSFTTCQDAVEGPHYMNFKNFQQSLQELASSDTAFSSCDQAGFYSCMHRVESSASS